MWAVDTKSLSTSIIYKEEIYSKKYESSKLDFVHLILKILKDTN